jgi:hypothetical protein
MSDLESAEFFAPSNIDMVDGLIDRYKSSLGSIERAAEYTQGKDFGAALGYFITGSNIDGRHREAPSFDAKPAISALNSNFWKIALDLTDVLDFMPSKRREEWFESITKMETPDFEEATVRSTLSSLLSQRMDFLAEKVDGIFQSLSKAHITNQPEGFSKRMILTGVTDSWGSYGRDKTGQVNDLRTVIAKFMGRDEPGYNSSNQLVEHARTYHRGDWVTVDGGALRVRCYLNGNAHLEVHPDMAWRLNQVMAHLHPSAIPSRFRQKPARKKREYTLMDKPLPFAVLNMLGGMKQMRTNKMGRGFEEIEPLTTNKNSLQFYYGDKDKHVLAEAVEVLALLGGVKFTQKGASWFEFSYDVMPVIKDIICSGCIPDQKSHQFYPTPEHIAKEAVEIASINETHDCLEPSAGIGGLADHMVVCDSVTCVEVSELHCRALDQKGHYVVQADFLEWKSTIYFDRIVMNPPYSQGRWQAHIERAASMLKTDGVLVAILPSSAAGKDVLPGMNITWSQAHENQFKGASVDVVILKAVRM